MTKRNGTAPSGKRALTSSTQPTPNASTPGAEPASAPGGATPRRKRSKSTGGNTAGLKEPWKPGESGNPKGRPKGSVNLFQRIQNKLNELTPDQRKQLADEAAQAYVDSMLAGDDKILRDFLDREEGKAVQRLEHSGKDGEPLRVLAWPWEMNEQIAASPVADAAPESGNGRPVNGTVPGNRVRSALGKNGSE